METIAAALGVPILVVSQAAATLRTSRSDPPRATLNVSLAARDYFKARQFPSEAMWQTVNRELGIKR